MAFLTEPEPTRGVVLPVIPGISRIVAANPGPMTYHGTNTYLIESAGGLTVLDPGPRDNAHLRAVLAAIDGRRVTRILVTHSHLDHFGNVEGLKQATSAPSVAFERSAEADFTADIGLADGEAVEGWTAIHTPGHAADHLCFARADGVVFSADHVMGWSTTVVSPPRGDMADYFASLRRLLARDDRLYLPGHGPALPEPQAYMRELLAHRTQREAAILEAVTEGPQSTALLRDRLYSQAHPRLRAAAERNVLAHLLKLQGEGRVRQDGEVWRT